MSIKILVIEMTKKIKMMMIDIVRRGSGNVMLFMEKMN